MSPALLALLGVGVALVGLGALTARSPGRAVPDLDGYFDQWRDLHGGYDPRTGSTTLRVWLTGVFRACRPFASAGVQPDVITLVGTWGVAAAAVSAGAGEGGGFLRSGPFWASWILLGAALLDNADGCVAILSGRTSAWGYVLDSTADRVCDVLGLLGLWAAGAPVWACVAAGTGLGLLEYVRSRATSAGMTEVGVVSLGERPNRITVNCLGMFTAGLFPAHRTLCAGLGAGAMLGLTAVGLVQLLLVVRRRLVVLPGVTAP